jgi:hypothetical protein
MEHLLCGTNIQLQRDTQKRNNEQSSFFLADHKQNWSNRKHEEKEW